MIKPANVRLIPNTIIRHPNVSDADYFGKKFENYVSNSSLKHLNPDEGGTPHNYATRKSIQSNSLELGTAVHRAILEGDKYVLSEVAKPTSKIAEIVEQAYIATRDTGLSYEDAIRTTCIFLGYYAGGLTTARVEAVIVAGREYFDFLVEANGKECIVLPSDQRDKFLKATKSIKVNQEIADLLKPSTDIFNVLTFSEDVFTAKIEVTLPSEFLDDVVEVDIKCKVDNWTIDFDNKIVTINDLKTTSYPIQGFMGSWKNENLPADDGASVVTSKRFVKGSFQKWHYQRQMAFYQWVIQEYCIEEWGLDFFDWTFKVNMIVAETVPPFNAHVFPVSEAWIDLGSIELNSVLGRLAWHIIHGFDKIPEFDNRATKTGTTV